MQTSENNIEYFDEIAFAELMRLVLIQVEALPFDRNVIIKKYYLQGMRHKEIVSELASTENVVRMHKQKAIKQLRKKLQILKCLIA